MEIRMEKVGFGYTPDHQVLSDIDLILNEPGLVCILGPNGVGKSTLIKCMNKLLRPTSGKVFLDGTDVSEMSQKEVALKIGYVPVRTEDTFAMTVFETVMVGRHNKQKWRTTGADVIKVNKALEAMHLSEFADRPLDELSAGQHQRVSIARGLIQETEILILDEPSSNLDIKYKIFVSELLHEIALRKNMLIIMISHNLEVASMCADKVVLMGKPGRIVQIGTPSEVLTPENIKKVYCVNCTVVEHEGHPQLLYSNVLDDDLDSFD